jgi:GNAT superfamily N-acetyltransferase
MDDTQEVAMAFTIRQAAPEDAQTVATLNADVQQLHADALPRVYKQPDHVAARQTFAEWLASPDVTCFIAFAGADPAGYIFLRAVRREENPFLHERAFLYIDQMSVAEAYRGTGCARLLMDAARAHARDTGVTELGLDVLAFNERARRFYEKEGFDVYRTVMTAEVDATGTRTASEEE